jgi:serine/threonine protein kinase
MEKHALNKLKAKYGNEMPSVQLIGTFKDMDNLYFIMEMLKSKNEMWLACRNFGILSDFQTRLTFKEICRCVKKLHDVNIIHRDLKVRYLA